MLNYNHVHIMIFDYDAIGINLSSGTHIIRL